MLPARGPRRHSSAAEHRFRKAGVLGSNPSAGFSFMSVHDFRSVKLSASPEDRFLASNYNGDPIQEYLQFYNLGVRRALQRLCVPGLFDRRDRRRRRLRAGDGDTRSPGVNTRGPVERIKQKAMDFDYYLRSVDRRRGRSNGDVDAEIEAFHVLVGDDCAVLVRCRGTCSCVQIVAAVKSRCWL
jgi:hypothetical protein